MRAFSCPGLAVVFPVYGVADVMAFVSIPQWPRAYLFTSTAVIFSSFLLVRMRACSLLIRSPEISKISRRMNAVWRACGKSMPSALVIQQDRLLIRPRPCSSVTCCGAFFAPGQCRHHADCQHELHRGLYSLRAARVGDTCQHA